MWLCWNILFSRRGRQLGNESSRNLTNCFVLAWSDFWIGIDPIEVPHGLKIKKYTSTSGIVDLPPSGGKL